MNHSVQEFLTFYNDRRRPLDHFDDLKRTLNANRCNPNWNQSGVMHVWRRKENDYLYIGEIDLGTMPPYSYLDEFIKEFLDKNER